AAGGAGRPVRRAPPRRRPAPGRDDRGLRTDPRRRPAHALRSVAAGRPARVPLGAGPRRGVAAAGRHSLLDAALLHRRCAARVAGAGHRRDHRRGHRMRVTRIPVEAALVPGLRLPLPDDAAAYVARVLRMQPGDACVLFNGDGHDYAARVLSVGKRGVEVEVLEATPVDRESPLKIVLLQGIARGEKMDWVLQKATELGVAAFVPVSSERSEVRLDAARAAKRLAHWRGVVASACGQCGRARIPPVEAPQPLDEALAALGPGPRFLL